MTSSQPSPPPSLLSSSPTFQSTSSRSSSARSLHRVPTVTLSDHFSYDLLDQMNYPLLCPVHCIKNTTHLRRCASSKSRGRVVEERPVPMMMLPASLSRIISQDSIHLLLARHSAGCPSPNCELEHYTGPHSPFDDITSVSMVNLEDFQRDITFLSNGKVGQDNEYLDSFFNVGDLERERRKGYRALVALKSSMRNEQKGKEEKKVRGCPTCQKLFARWGGSQEKYLTWFWNRMKKVSRSMQFCVRIAHTC